ncbi:MAG: hypothetical protein FWC76_08800, partial [Defluviitaleaceae bacterium]|nr:hypothetical protein [Defluviitaleaceae bacterium]
MKIKRMSIFILGICILLTACQPPQMADVEVPPQMVEVDEPPNEELPDEPEEDSYEEVNIGEMLIHWDDGTIQYGSRNEGDFLVLYEISGNGAEMTQIATFRSFYTPYGLLPRIMSFDILDSWIIFTLGGFLESDHRLANVFFRMKRGGSELSEIFVYWNDGIIQYGSRIGDDDSRVLYEIRGQGAE